MRLRGVWSVSYAVLGLGRLWGASTLRWDCRVMGVWEPSCVGGRTLLKSLLGCRWKRNAFSEIWFSSSPVPPAPTQTQPRCPYDTLEGVASRGPLGLGHAPRNVRPASWYPGSPVLTEALMSARIRGQQSPTSQTVFSPRRDGGGKERVG